MGLLALAPFVLYAWFRFDEQGSSQEVADSRHQAHRRGGVWKGRGREIHYCRFVFGKITALRMLNYCFPCSQSCTRTLLS